MRENVSREKALRSKERGLRLSGREKRALAVLARIRHDSDNAGKNKLAEIGLRRVTLKGRFYKGIRRNYSKIG
jgi:hypothetical protein